MTGCATVEACTSVGEGGREKISASGVGQLREKTYVTARADTDTALPISARSQCPTARQSPRYEIACDEPEKVVAVRGSLCSSQLATLPEEETAARGKQHVQGREAGFVPAAVLLAPPPLTRASESVGFAESLSQQPSLKLGLERPQDGVSPAELPNLLVLSARELPASLEAHPEIGVLLSEGETVEAASLPATTRLPSTQLSPPSPLATTDPLAPLLMAHGDSQGETPAREPSQAAAPAADLVAAASPASAALVPTLALKSPQMPPYETPREVSLPDLGLEVKVQRLP